MVDQIPRTAAEIVDRGSVHVNADVVIERGEDVLKVDGWSAGKALWKAI